MVATRRESSNGLLPLALSMLAGALLAWGLGSACHRKEVDQWKLDRAQLVSADSIRDSQTANMQTERARLLTEIDALSVPDPRIAQMRVIMTQARQRAVDALGLAGSTTDSLAVVIVALRGAGEREDALLVVVDSMERRLLTVRDLSWRAQRVSDSLLGVMTRSRDGWRAIALAAPIDVPVTRWTLGLPRPTCVVGLGVVVAGKVGAGLGVTCGLPVLR